MSLFALVDSTRHISDRSVCSDSTQKLADKRGEDGMSVARGV